MPDIVSTLTKYGYESLFLVLFLEAIGVPIPGALALLAAGAASARGSLRPVIALPVAALAMLLGDTLLYLLGRYAGWGLLGLLCRISLNPETCILRSAESFYRRGRTTLLFAKFIPGINTMAPPLAGSMNMKLGQFLRLDFGGVLAYVLAYGATGFLFKELLQVIVRGLQAVSTAIEWLILIGLLAYITHRVWLYRKHRMYSVAPRVEVAELAARRDSQDPLAILIADVRSHGYYDAGARRISGSIRLEPNNLHTTMQTLPKEKQIYLYCT